MMDTLYPRLRSHLSKSEDPRQPRFVHVVDRLGLASPLRLSAEEFAWLDLFDGTRTVADMHGEGMRRADGRRIERSRFDDLARRLDANLFLDGPRFRQIVEGRVRPPRCIGSYEGDPELLERQITRLFTGRGGPGLPGPCRSDSTLCAALVPHIDYPRGGVTYAWGFKEVAEKTAASLFVIIGTSHYSQQRFTLTRKDFETPLGIVPTDQHAVDALVRHYGPGLFDDEWLAHLPEHSIELEVVFLQYLFRAHRPLRIVPLVVGSFFDCVAAGDPPGNRPDIARMARALRQMEADLGEPVCYLISGDLAHLGPKFQDPLRLDSARLLRSRQQDLALLHRAEAADHAGYFQIVAEEADARNICGLPPTFLFLEAVQPRSGRLLHYDQYVDPAGHESVSFASMAFYQ